VILGVVTTPFSSLAPLSQARIATAAAQNQAMALVQRTRDETRRLDSLSADLQGVLGSDHFTGQLLLKRPNFARVEINSTGSLGSFLIISDGATVTTYFKGDNQYVQSPSGSTGQYIQGFVAEQVRDFFRPESIAARGKLNYVGREQSEEGKAFDVVEVSGGGPGSATARYFISPENNLIHRVLVNGHQTSSASISNVHKNVSIDPAVFKWTLPATAKAVQLPAGLQIPVKK
jgi:outer membrane lipoprotein-sorting protein